MTPGCAGNNDDLYWLHCAVLNGRSCYVVSNDQMRDHNFGMLSPKAFLKWRERHQVCTRSGARWEGLVACEV